MTSLNELVEKRFDKIDAALEVQAAQLASIDATLKVQQTDINHHILRTDLLQDQVLPIRNTYLQILGIGKLIAFLGLLASIAAALSVVLRHGVH